MVLENIIHERDDDAMINVRVWFDAGDPQDPILPGKDRTLLSSAMMSMAGQWPTHPHAAALILWSKLTRVNAIEVRYPEGRGVVLYPEWP